MAIAPNTTKLGITVFDQAFGGIYLHKPTILCGRRKSGKFVVATQLMVKTLRVGGRVVLFTAKNSW
jgi:KaiC/GvpD/RAD55 family RecA-like ATPase